VSNVIDFRCGSQPEVTDKTRDAGTSPEGRLRQKLLAAIDLQISAAKAEANGEEFVRQPFAKVPAFEHDGFELYETGAIMHYVDETFAGPSLQPGEPRERARMMQVMGLINAYAYPSCIGACVIQRLVVPLTGGTPDEDVVAEAVPLATTSVEALDALIGDNAYLTGATLSLADLHLAPVYDYFSQTPEGETALAGTPNLRRWWDGMSQRASVQKTKPALG